MIKKNVIKEYKTLAKYQLRHTKNGYKDLTYYTISPKKIFNITKEDIKILFLNNHKRYFLKTDIIREIRRIFNPNQLKEFLIKNPELLEYLI